MRSTRRSRARCGQPQMNINVIWNDDAGHPEWDGETVTVHYRDSNPDDYLYMYLDESGNLDFKQSGTPFFLMTCVVATRPFNSADAMRELRYDLMEKGMDIQKFHACDDKNEVRKSVYRILSAQNCNYRVYSVYVDKSEVPDEMRTPESVYSKVFSLLLDEIYRAEGIINLEGIVVITDRLPKDATKRQVVKPLKRYMKEKFQARHIPYVLMHHDSASDMNLQAADYYCWAAQRDLAQDKRWPMCAVYPFFRRVGKVEFKE